MRKIFKKFLAKYNKKYNLLLCAVLGIFAIEVMFFILNVKIGEPPDERYHIALSILQSKSLSPFLENSELTYSLGYVSNRPFFYHYLLGLLSHLNILNLPVSIYFRLINLGLSAGTLYYLYKLTREVVRSKYLSVLPVILMSQVLMFNFLSGAVNYDNLINLLAVMAFYKLFRIFRGKTSEKFTHFLHLAVLLLIGTLTKRTFLVIGLIIVVFLVTYLLSQSRQVTREQILGNVRATWARLKTSILFFIALISILTLANLAVYGGNLIQYGRITPKCKQVIGYENCMKNFVYEKQDELKEELESGETFIVPFEEYMKNWSWRMIKSSFGVSSHNIFYQESPSRYLYFLFGGLAGLLLIVNFIRIISDGVDKKLKSFLSKSAILLGSFISYTVVAIIFMHENYSETGSLSWVINGRYLFPVLGLLFAFIAYQIAKFFNVTDEDQVVQISISKEKLFAAALVLLAAISVYLSFCTFLQDPLFQQIKLNWETIDDSYQEYHKFL